MKRVLNRRSSSKGVSKDWKALSNFIKKGRAPPITAVLASDQGNHIEGVESVQKTYAVETNEILQQIEQKWEPVFNRPKEASFEEFLERCRNYVQIQQCTIPELTGKDLKSKGNFAHEVSRHVWLETAGHLTLLFSFLFLSFFLMYDSDYDSVTNNLRDSANGTFVTLDDFSHFTGYEPNDTELINDTELNDSVPSKFTDFQDSLVHFAPSSGHDVDDETLGKLLAEVHRDYADYRRPEGVSVSPSSMSVMVDRTGKPVE